MNYNLNILIYILSKQYIEDPLFMLIMGYTCNVVLHYLMAFNSLLFLKTSTSADYFNSNLPLLFHAIKLSS